MSALSKKGFFVISIDVEMAWSLFDLGKTEKHKKDFEKSRDIITRLICLFEKYGVAVTWAIVGHLFLDSCTPQDGIHHPDMPRPTYPWFTDDWYTQDPGTDKDRHPIWYGRDIIDVIRSSTVHHEIACHSFSHVTFGHTGCSQEVAQKEIAKCRDLAQNMGLTLESFVFPRNKPGHLAVLKENGFKIYRSEDRGWSSRFKGSFLLYNLAQFIEEYLSLTPPCSVPEETLPGLWALPGSMLYRSRNGIMKLLPIARRIKRAVRGVHQAVDTGTVFQLWFHPWHIVNDSEELLAGLETILEEAIRLRNEGDLEITTLSKIPEIWSSERKLLNDAKSVTI